MPLTPASPRPLAVQCCACRRVREGDAWVHAPVPAGAGVSHGLCPGCLADLYPEAAAAVRPCSRPTPVDLGRKTAPVRRIDREAAAPPPPIVVCEGCGAVADLPAPAGWETAPAADGNAAGHCPACRAETT